MLKTKGFHYYEEPKAAKFLFGSPKAAWIWLPVRLYFGYYWFLFGYRKVFGVWRDLFWVTGDGVKGYAEASTTALEGSDPPAFFGWYGNFLEWIADGNYHWLGKAVALGELLIGVGLILGAFTGIAAFFGVLLNFNMFFAGTAGPAPLFLLGGLALVMAWRVAGYYGLDRYLLPILGTPTEPGEIFHRHKEKPIQPARAA